MAQRFRTERKIRFSHCDPAGNRHEAYSPEGCIILGFFMRPNRFLKPAS